MFNKKYIFNEDDASNDAGTQASAEGSKDTTEPAGNNEEKSASTPNNPEIKISGEVKSEVDSTDRNGITLGKISTAIKDLFTKYLDGCTSPEKTAEQIKKFNIACGGNEAGELIVTDPGTYQYSNAQGDAQKIKEILAQLKSYENFKKSLNSTATMLNDKIEGLEKQITDMLNNYVDNSAKDALNELNDLRQIYDEAIKLQNTMETNIKASDAYNKKVDQTINSASKETQDNETKNKATYSTTGNDSIGANSIKEYNEKVTEFKQKINGFISQAKQALDNNSNNAGPDAELNKNGINIKINLYKKLFNVLEYKETNDIKVTNKQELSENFQYETNINCFILNEDGDTFKFNDTEGAKNPLGNNKNWDSIVNNTITEYKSNLMKKSSFKSIDAKTSFLQQAVANVKKATDIAITQYEKWSDINTTGFKTLVDNYNAAVEQKNNAEAKQAAEQISSAEQEGDLEEKEQQRQQRIKDEKATT